ncbi:MAG: hypothetical protein K5773_05350 [Pseudobutyrivibrio sp.]|nr:hypothetical protein [Pseudobutyrivibrio sp.]
MKKYTPEELHRAISSAKNLPDSKHLEAVVIPRIMADFIGMLMKAKPEETVEETYYIEGTTNGIILQGKNRQILFFDIK